MGIKSVPLGEVDPRLGNRCQPLRALRMGAPPLICTINRHGFSSLTKLFSANEAGTGDD